MILTYIGLYCMVGAIYAYLTRKQLFLPISKEENPVGVLLVLTFFWLPLEVGYRLKSIKETIQSWFTYTINDLEKDLSKDTRFIRKDDTFFQIDDFCINCKCTEDTVLEEVDVTHDEKEGDSFFYVTYYICRDCSDRDIHVLDVLEHKKKL